MTATAGGTGDFSGDVREIWEAAERLPDDFPTDPGPTVLDEAATVLESVADLIEADWDLSRDLRGLTATAMAIVVLHRGETEQAYEGAASRVLFAAQVLRAEMAGADAEVSRPSGTVWPAVGEAMLIASEELQRPSLLEGSIVASRRTFTDTEATDDDRLVASQDIGLATTNLYLAGGTREARERLVEAALALPKGVAVQTRVCLAAGEAMLKWGERQCCLDTFRSAETVVSQALEGRPSDAGQRQLLLLLRALRSYRAVLADPAIAKERAVASPSVYEELATVVPLEIEADLADAPRQQGAPTVVDIAQAGGEHHWRAFLEMRAARGAADPMEGVEITVIPHEGEEQIDMTLRLDAELATQQELNAALGMYALVAAERPKAVPPAIRGPSEIMAQAGARLASMALDRAIELLEANDRKPDREKVRTAVRKLARAASSPNVPAGLRDLLAAVLGDGLIRLYKVDRDPRTLERAIAILRRAANCGRENRRRSRRNLAEALGMLSGLGDESALDEAIVHLRRMVSAPDMLPEDLVSLASALQSRYRASHHPEDLYELIGALNQGLANSDLDPEVKRAAHEMLGDAFTQVYDKTEDLSTLLEATLHDRAALALTEPESTKHRFALMEVATDLDKQFDRTSDMTVLEEAARLSRLACENLDPTDPDEATLLIDHTSVIGSWSEQTGKSQDLTALLPLLRAAVTAFSDRPRFVMSAQNKLSLILARLWDTGVPIDLEEAVTAAREAVAIASSQANPQAGYFGNLGYLLFELHGVSGDLELLDESIRYHRQALDLAEDLPVERRIGELNLAAALVRRSGDREDGAALREAIDLLRRLVDSSNERSVQPIVLSLLGGALIRLHGRDRKEDVLVEAVDVLRRSVALSEGGLQHDRHLNNLGQALSILSGIRQDPELLEQSIELSATAMSLVPRGHPLRPDYVMTHAQLLLDRQAASEQDETSLRTAETLLLEIINSDVKGSVSNMAWQRIGNLFQRLGQDEGKPRLEEMAASMFRYAAKIENAAPHWRATSAQSWGQAALRLGSLQEARAAFGLVIDIVDAASGWDLEPADQERWLAKFRGAARLAAACAIGLDDPEAAVELLERGRGVLFGRTVAARQRIGRLRAAAPALADELTRLEAETVELAKPSPIPEDPMADSRRNARRAQFDEQRRRLLVKIHRLPGLEELGLPPRISSLLPALPAEGPVVVVNVSPIRCDALLVTPDGVRLVPLPGLSEDDLENRTELFVGAMEILNRDDTPDLELAVSARVIAFGTLEWLWEAVTGPVLEALGITAPSADPPRIWWCPTGSLSFLPLHAAGRHKADGPHDTVLDRVVSSYVPTLRGLAEAAPEDSETDDVALMIAVSKGRYSGLPALIVDRDINAFAARFPNGQVLRDEDAVADRVMTELRTATVVQMATHAHQEIRNPSAGSVDLWDRPVTIAELRAAVGTPGRLAILLGCETARGGWSLADESISLVTALQHAGFRHAIGAMWPLDDGDAERFAQAAYSASDPARALADASRALRDERPMAPNRWAGLVHIGP